MAAPNLDTSWIDDYEDIEKKYEMFYKENIASINVIMIYVNSVLEIEKISQRDLELNTYNTVSKDEILEIVNSNSYVGDIKYKLLSLLTYNISLTHNDLKGFLESDVGDNSREFLHSLTTLEDIHLTPSIQLFQDINSLVVVYYEKSESSYGQKKQKEPGSKQNTTKKIYINTKNVSKKQKKTKRQH
ncbi:MAG: hypothetical protein ACXABD_01515 [Candidatus Thorarchaeota archaeon]|jgi:hypothetical protein